MNDLNKLRVIWIFIISNNSSIQKRSERSNLTRERSI